ncbi:MAG: DUF6499 domain-containing protein [Hyphomonadaceae bacterium]
MGEQMSFLNNWRTPVGADDLRGMERPDFALEFLRRNPDYQRDEAALERLIARGRTDAAAAERALVRRWGLQFRC